MKGKRERSRGEREEGREKGRGKEGTVNSLLACTCTYMYMYLP